MSARYCSTFRAISADAYDIGVIAIAGPSYCGSTVISYVLNTDPKIYGGSELRRVVEKNDTIRCLLCGPKCPYWTPGALDRFSDRGDVPGARHFYKKISEIFGVGLIADASKVSKFFSEGFIAEQEFSDGVRFAFVIPVKHPIRLYASFVFNDFFWRQGRRPAEYAEVRRALEGPLAGEVFEGYLPSTANRLLRLYRGFYKRFATPPRAALTVKHETFVSEGGAAPLAAFVRDHLGYEPTLDTDDYASYEAHPIGGNRGPYWQAALDRDREFSASSPRFRYYRDKRGLQLDRKHLDILPADMTRRLLDWETTHELAAVMSYSDDELYAIAEES